MSAHPEQIHPTASEFKRVYQTRLIIGQLICYAILIFSVIKRATLDQLGAWQGAIFACICVGWVLAFGGAMIRERYHNFGKHDSRYEEVDSLRGHYAKYMLSMMFTLLASLGAYLWIHVTLPDYMLNVARVEDSSQILQRDTGIDYYRVGRVDVNMGGFHWFWMKDTHKGEIRGVDVTGIIELERRDQRRSAYLYSKTYHSSRGKISEQAVPGLREHLYQQARRELTSARVFERKCLKRLRASQNLKHHLTTMQEDWGSYKPRHTLFLSEVDAQECDPPELTSAVIWRYITWCGGLFVVFLYLMRVMVRAQHNMALCMEAHEEKRKREAERALANKKEYDSAWDYPL